MKNNTHKDHLKRDGFRYEDKAVTQPDAFIIASARSLRTNKVISVLKNDHSEDYLINSHGIDLTGYTRIAQFQKGNKLDTIQTNKAKELLSQVKEMLGPIVERIEKSPATTKNHYGDYMVVLSHAKSQEGMKKLAAMLILVGANEEGVANALKLSI